MALSASSVGSPCSVLRDRRTKTHGVHQSWEDDRVAATLSKFFKNKQREETMAEAARTTGAINRALMHKKGAH
eukprot:2765422-Amphidinium_carterae.1